MSGCTCLFSTTLYTTQVVIIAFYRLMTRLKSNLGGKFKFHKFFGVIDNRQKKVGKLLNLIYGDELVSHETDLGENTWEG